MDRTRPCEGRNAGSIPAGTNLTFDPLICTILKHLPSEQGRCFCFEQF